MKIEHKPQHPVGWNISNGAGKSLVQKEGQKSTVHQKLCQHSEYWPWAWTWTYAGQHKGLWQAMMPPRVTDILNFNSLFNSLSSILILIQCHYFISRAPLSTIYSAWQASSMICLVTTEEGPIGKQLLWEAACLPEETVWPQRCRTGRSSPLWSVSASMLLLWCSFCSSSQFWVCWHCLLILAK